LKRFDHPVRGAYHQGEMKWPGHLSIHTCICRSIMIRSFRQVATRLYPLPHSRNPSENRHS
jgi:hypothetical protein